MSTFAWPAFARESVAQNTDGLLDAARIQGREEGYAQGQQQALAEQAEVKAMLVAALQELQSKRDGLPAQYESAITNLVFTTLQALLRVELVTNREVISSLVAEALDVLNAKLDAVTVRVNPEDVHWLQSAGDIEMVADDTVPVGGLAVAMPDLCVEFDLMGKLRELSELSLEDAHTRSDDDGLSPSDA